MSTETAAVRSACGLLPGSLRALHRLIGSDRTTFLQGMLSNDVARLSPGQGTYATHLTQQGRIVSDLRVFVLEDEVWLDVPATRLRPLREALERFLVADDVEFLDGNEYEPLLALEGPQAFTIAAAVFAAPFEDLPQYAHRAATFRTTKVRVAAASHTGEHGVLIFGPLPVANELQAACRAAGATPVSATATDVLRLEAGIPWFDRDMDESTLVAEIGLRDAISFQKGCYIGQEVVERVSARGQVQKKLVGMIVSESTPPASGTKLLSGSNEVGWITSAAWSDTRNAIIALGYVRREHWEIDTALTLPDGRSARVAPVPFVPCPAFA